MSSIGLTCFSAIHDFDNTTTYDSLIESANERMKKQDICDKLGEVTALINTLSTLRNTFRPRFPNGYNLGLAIPHRSRIDMRVNLLKGECELLKIGQEKYIKNEQNKTMLAALNAYTETVTKQGFNPNQAGCSIFSKL